MKTFLKNNWLRIVSPLVVIVILFFIFNPSGTSKDVEVKSSFTPVNLTWAGEITCTFSRTVGTHYSNNKIFHSLFKEEKESMVNTFSNIDDPKTGQMSYIDSTKTITTIPIIKLMADEEKIVYLAGGDENHTTIYYIYKKLGVATYSKNVSLLGIPSTTSSMGTCVGSW